MQPMTTKNDHIGFRLPKSLKKELYGIAKGEGRTLSRICEIFVYGGLETYRKEGSGYLQRLLNQQKHPKVGSKSAATDPAARNVKSNAE